MSIKTMGCVASAFGITVISFYALYRALVAVTGTNTQLTIVQVAWALYFKICTIVLIAGGSSTTREVIFIMPLTNKFRV